MRKLVTVKQVEAIESIPGADNIEMARIGGWSCVVKKEEFQVGDYGLFHEIDSFVPTQDPRYVFLAKNQREWNGKTGTVIRTMKLRGQLSQGLLLPLRDFPELLYKNVWLGFKVRVTDPSILVDTDFSDELGVYKYEKEIDGGFQDTSTWVYRLIRKIVPRKYRVKFYEVINTYFPDERIRNKDGRRLSSTLPSFLKKTDQERCQNLWSNFTEEQRSTVYEVTLKLDGSSAQYYFKDGVFGLTSRNQKRGIEDGSNFAKIPKKYPLEIALTTMGRNISICGELMGPNIQGNRENLEDYEFFVFDIWDIDARKYLGVVDRQEVLTKLKTLDCNLKVAPVIGEMTLANFPTLKDLLDFTKGPSINNKIREGLVFKSLDGQFSWKVINNEFLLKEKD